MVLTLRRYVLIAAARNGWPAWLAVCGVVFAALGGWALAAHSSAAVRYAGTILQVLGLATVAVGLSQVRRLFGRPSLSRKILGWFRLVWESFRPPKPITVKAEAGGIALVGGEARLTVRAGPGSSLDRRVAILEENLERLRDEVDANETKLKREISALSEGLGREQRAREAEDRQTSVRMEELAVGGLHLEFVGLLWLMLGVLGTSVPDELARLLSALLRAAAQLPVPPARSLALLACGW